MKFSFEKGHIPASVWFAFFAALIIAYALLQPPLRSVAINLQPMILALVFLASFCGIGAPWVVLFRLDSHPGEAALLSVAIGIGATGLFVFTLGLLGHTAPVLHSLWVLAGLLLFAYFLWKSRRRLKCRVSVQDPLTLLSLALLLPFLLLVIPPLVAPVTAMDSLYYQLLVPKIFLKMGEIAPIPFLVESNYPCLAQYVYMLVMNLASDVTCNALHLGLGLLSLLAMGRLSARLHPAGNRWLGPVLFFTMPAFIVSASWAWNDAFFVFFMLLCLSHLLAYHLAEDKKGALRNLILAGLLAGLASWVKYTFFMVLAPLLLLLLVGRCRWKWPGRHLAWFFFPLLPLSLLTSVKNWIFTGNPLFPFLHRVFPGPYWNDAAAAYFTQALRRFEIPQWDAATFLFFPFRLALQPPLIDVHIGIMPLVLLPLLFLRSRDKGISFLKAFGLFCLLSWFFFQTITRSLFTLLAVVLVIGAIELERRIWKNPAFRRSVVFFIGLASLANLLITITTHYHLTRPISYFLGLESRERYLLREAQSQPVYDWLNRAPQVNKVLLVGLHAPYYLQRDALFSSFTDPPIAESLSRGIAGSGQLATKLAGLGVSHVVIHQGQYDQENRDGLYSWSSRQRQVFEDFIARFCRPEVMSAQERIFRVQPPRN